MKTILVTGGAGFIGSHLVDRLSADAANHVIVLDNLRRGKTSNLNASLNRINFIQGDIRDRATLDNVTREVDTIYHLAAQSNVLGAVSDLDYSFSTNVHGTLQVLRAALANRVRRVVFTSSREVYGDSNGEPVHESAPLRPKNAYGASKAAGELYCRVFHSPAMQVRIVRLANVYGVRDFDRVIPIFANQAIRGETLTLFGGRQIIDFVWIDQVIESLIRAAEATGLPGPINVGTGIRTDLQTLASRIIEAAGSASKLNIAPARTEEVAQFVADTRLQKQYLGLEGPQDPLMYLPQVMKSLSPDHSELQTFAARGLS